MTAVYLDHAACTPVDPRVVAAASPYLGVRIGNPSTLHSRGLDAKRALEDARHQVATLVNAEADACIVFTADATEANNIAIRGGALRNVKLGKAVVSSAIEHISVLNPMKELQKQGFEYTKIPVDSTGMLKLDVAGDLITKGTSIVSVQYASGEIGTIQPIAQIAKVVHEAGALLHVDATAAAGHIPINVQAEGIDLLTVSSNDLAGPQGAGALYVRTGMRLQPVLVGGGQERGLRPGTEDLFAIVGMGEAARLAKTEMAAEATRVSAVRDALINGITPIEESFLTGHPTKRLPHHASFRFNFIEGESIVLLMDQQGIQVATGSACSSQTLEPSHVLLALGLKHEEVHGSMVMTLGRSTTLQDVPAVVAAVQQTVQRLRSLSPLSAERR